MRSINALSVKFIIISKTMIIISLALSL